MSTLLSTCLLIWHWTLGLHQIVSITWYQKTFLTSMSKWIKYWTCSWTQYWYRRIPYFVLNLSGWSEQLIVITLKRVGCEVHYCTGPRGFLDPTSGITDLRYWIYNTWARMCLSSSSCLNLCWCLNCDANGESLCDVIAGSECINSKAGYK